MKNNKSGNMCVTCNQIFAKKIQWMEKKTCTGKAHGALVAKLSDLERWLTVTWMTEELETEAV